MAEECIQRRLVGYSRLMGEDEEGMLAAVFDLIGV